MMEVVIEKVISNGCGMARDEDGKIFFVQGALAEETWLIESLEKRKGTYWGSGTRVTDSPIRVAPRCPHFGPCGGCALLHINQENEMEVKMGYLADVLTRVAGIEMPEVTAIDFPPEGSRIRGRLRVDHFGRIGFVGERSNNVVALKECHVIPERISQILPQLAKLVKHANFKGDIYFLTDITGQHAALELRGTARPGGLAPGRWKLPGVVGLSVLRTTDGKRLMTTGKPLLDFRWGEIKATMGPMSFLQSNPASWEAFFEVMKYYLTNYQPRRVWDVHAGSGFLSSQLGDLPFYASEPDKYAYAQLEEAINYAGFDARLFHGTAEEAIAADFFIPEAGDGLVLDPPREGLTKELTEWIKEKGPESVLYISCDMGSFARDIKRLGEHYAIDGAMLAMNVNPGTLRLETAAVLKRK